jgi:hypothetical protein
VTSMLGAGISPAPLSVLDRIDIYFFILVILLMLYLAAAPPACFNKSVIFSKNLPIVFNKSRESGVLLNNSCFSLLNVSNKKF